MTEPAPEELPRIEIDNTDNGALWVELLTVERLERRSAFQTIDGHLERLNARRTQLSFYRSSLESIHNRSVVILNHRRPSNHTPIVRVMVNDEVDLDVAGKRRVNRAHEYICQIHGRLIMSTMVNMPEQRTGSYEIGERGFLIQARQLDRVNVFYGPKYAQRFPDDSPEVNALQLSRRLEIAKELAGILGSISPTDQEPVTGISYSLVKPEGS